MHRLDQQVVDEADDEADVGIVAGDVLLVPKRVERLVGVCCCRGIIGGGRRRKDVVGGVRDIAVTVVVASRGARLF